MNYEKVLECLWNADSIVSAEGEWSPEREEEIEETLEGLSEAEKIISALSEGRAELVYKEVHKDESIS